MFCPSSHLSAVRWSRAHRCWSWTVTWRMTDMWWCHMMKICKGRQDAMSPSPHSICRSEDGCHGTVGQDRGHAETAALAAMGQTLFQSNVFLDYFFSPTCWHGRDLLDKSGYVSRLPLHFSSDIHLSLIAKLHANTNVHFKMIWDALNHAAGFLNYLVTTW